MVLYHGTEQNKITVSKEHSVITIYSSLSLIKLLKNINNIDIKLHSKNFSKLSLILENFQKNINLDLLEKHLYKNPHTIITPAMFEHQLLVRAKEFKQTIVLPESEDARILQAANILLNREIVNIVLLGDPNIINEKASHLGINLDKATIINPLTDPLRQQLSKELFKLRKHKGLSLEDAKALITQNKNYFATMMVKMNLANAMVSGANNTTADTVRPALQIIKTTKESPIVSSCFLMCMDTKVLVFADCAINQNPNSQELSHIAVASAQTACQFGLIPKVAFLSYATADSCSSEDTAKIYEAATITKYLEMFDTDGPLQYDAAIDKEVAKKKMPGSKVAGEATVLIFPDLNTGNNTYKAVQRSSGAIAIGPILQGLQKPVNDLSRGCSVKDIINTIAITAIQAQGVCSANLSD